MKLLKTLAVTGIAGLAASAVLGSSAFAEPTPSGPRALAGVGSDTTQDVLNALSEVVVAGDGTKLIASYDATGGGTVTTKSAAGCTFARPNGSGAGRTALLKSLNPSDPTFGCLDFARSSSLNLAPTDVSLTYVPFAVDAVSYAVTSSSSIPKDLTKARLAAIYRCEDPAVPAPLLPQAGSGTRAFWLAQMGLTETTKGACVVDAKAGVPVQENSGAPITGATDIVPFSVAGYLAQSNGAANDTRGTAVLGSVDGVTPTTGSPAVLNPAFGIKRSVYNVIPTAKTGTAPTSDVFVGSGSKVCQQTAVIQRLGFGLSPQCGATTDQTPTTGTTSPTPSASVSPSPSPSASPSASSSPSASASASPTASGVALLPLQLGAASPASPTPGVQVSIPVSGTPGQSVELVAYSRPSTEYAVARTQTLDGGGRTVFVVSPGTNTRYYVRYAGQEATKTATAALSVRTAISLSVRKLASKQYVFEGRLLPRRAGQLITLYRVTGASSTVAAQVRSDSTGTWRIPRTFTGTGTFDFQVKTGVTLDNAAGVSNVKRVAVS